MTCGEWIAMAEADRVAAAATMLNTMRAFDDPAAAAPDAAQAATLSEAITPLCGAGSDCDAVDAWCDSAPVTDPAWSAYIERHDELQS
jgi:hypothetical protein